MFVPVAAFLEKMAEAKASLPGAQRAPFPARLNVLVDRTKEVAWLSYLQVRNHLAAKRGLREKLCLPTTPLYSGIGKTALGQLVQTHLRSDKDTQDLVVNMVLDSLVGSVAETDVRAALQDFLDVIYIQLELPNASDEGFPFLMRQRIFELLSSKAPNSNRALFANLHPSPQEADLSSMLTALGHQPDVTVFVHFDELDLSESQAELFIQFAFDNFLLYPGRYIFCTGHSATLWKRAIDTRSSNKSPCTDKLIPISALSQGGILELLKHLRNSNSSSSNRGFCINIDGRCLEYLSQQLKLKTGGVSLIVVESLRVLHHHPGRISTPEVIDGLLYNGGEVMQQVLRVDRVNAEQTAT